MPLFSVSAHDIKTCVRDFFAQYSRVQNWALLDLTELPHGENLNHWLDSGYSGQMEFMDKTRSLRLNPQEWFAHAQSALVWLWDYPESLKPFNENPNHPQISSYAMGVDYHFELGKMGRDLNELLRQRFDIETRSFADAQPVFERDWALLSGLGWLGKNTFLINRDSGTSFFISGIFLNLHLQVDAVGPAQDFCGKCTRCLEACPTDAFVEPYVLDATKCLSYLTIEHKGMTPKEFWGLNGGYIFGCDICQQVCPWNHKEIVAAKKKPENIALNESELSLIEWLRLCRKGGGFQSRFKGSALMRAGRQKMMRNVALEAYRLKDEPSHELLSEIVQEEEGWLREFLNELLGEWKN